MSGSTHLNGKLLLDTNIVIAVLNRDTVVSQRLQGSSEIYLCSIVLGELYYGALNSKRVVDNLARLEELTREIPVLPSDRLTAREYAEIRRQLKNDGTPIPENDIWIAAIACQHSLILVSRDRHFGDVQGLSLELC